ncbi:MAG: MFS transporter [Planctomycetes bacterium]|nr:MFS transporter [Planctomycetota bacterium]
MSTTLPPEHSAAFRARRFLNWFPMGLAYALLYMGRYNLTVSKTALGPLMTKEDFGLIFGAGTITYAFAFLLNGPLVDKIGGRAGILFAAFGSGLMNLAMGIFLALQLDAGGGGGRSLTTIFALLYAINMYFQSFGAVAIVKVNAHWFHVRERGGFSGIFGTMIASGIFLAFTVNGWILDAMAAAQGVTPTYAAKWVFFFPAAFLGLIALVELFLLKDKPSQAGHADFDTGDAWSDEKGSASLGEILKRVLTHPVILTVALIEFCTGVLRNGVMHWFPIYAAEVWVLPSSHWLRNGSWDRVPLVLALFAMSIVFLSLAKRSSGVHRARYVVSGGLAFLSPFFFQGGWGGLLFVAGVIGGNLAGWLSDLFFQSRRAPVAGLLYALLAVASIGMFVTLGGTEARVGWAENPSTPLRAGDRVLSIEGHATATWADVDEQLDLAAAEAKPRVSVRFLRSGSELGVQAELNYLEQQLSRAGILPRGALRAVDPGAAPEVLGFEVGDRLLAIAQDHSGLAAQEREGAFQSWLQVSQAIASVPAFGKDGARWDPEKKMVSSTGSGLAPGERFTDGALHVALERAGKRQELLLADPSPSMRAGDRRQIKAGPVLTLDPLWLGLVIFVMSIGVIGAHGLLSGTATMDFGGKKGAATAVGMIDGFVYLGTALQSFSLGYLTTRDWAYWPMFLCPFGVVGFLLLLRIWHAIPRGGGRGH